MEREQKLSASSLARFFLEGHINRYTLLPQFSYTTLGPPTLLLVRASLSNLFLYSEALTSLASIRSYITKPLAHHKINQFHPPLLLLQKKKLLLNHRHHYARISEQHLTFVMSMDALQDKYIQLKDEERNNGEKPRSRNKPSLAEEKEAKRISDAIDRQIHLERLAKEREKSAKLLLLGKRSSWVVGSAACFVFLFRS